MVKSACILTMHSKILFKIEPNITYQSPDVSDVIEMADKRLLITLYGL